MNRQARIRVAIWVASLLALPVIAWADGHFASRMTAPATSPAGEPSKSPAPARAYPFSVKVVGKGRPVLFIPGLTCSGDVWNDTVAKLSADYECHVLTPAGFAGEPPVEGPFIEAMRDGIVKYIHDKNLKQPAIVGHSIGGFLGYVLAVDAPESVGPIICLDSLPCLAAANSPNVTPAQLTAIGDQMERMSTSMTRQQFAAQQKPTLTLWISDEPHRKQVADWGDASDLPEVGRAMAGLIRRDMRGEVPKIKSPLLLIAAGAPTPGADAQAVRKTYEDQVAPIPQHELVFAEKSHHFVMFDEPEFVVTQIQTFLAKHP